MTTPAGPGDAACPPARTPQDWPGVEAVPADTSLLARCGACGETWRVHPDLGGFRIRCTCTAMVPVPATRTAAVAAMPRPATAAVMARVASSLAPAEEATPDEREPLSETARSRIINRFWIQLLLVLGCLIAPRTLVGLAVTGPDQAALWPYATVVSAALILVLGACWPATAFGALRLPTSRWTAAGVALGLGTGLIGLGYTLAWITSTGSVHHSALTSDAMPLAAALLVVAMGPAFCEEIAFRGMLQASMIEAWGERLGWFTTAVAFALCHGITLGFPLHLSLGLLLGWVRLRSHSLLPGMVIHLVYNALLIIGLHGT